MSSQSTSYRVWSCDLQATNQGSCCSLLSRDFGCVWLKCLFWWSLSAKFSCILLRILAARCHELQALLRKLYSASFTPQALLRKLYSASFTPQAYSASFTFKYTNHNYRETNLQETNLSYLKSALSLLMQLSHKLLHTALINYYTVLQISNTRTLY